MGEFSPNEHSAQEARIEILNLSLARTLEYADQRSRSGTCDDVGQAVIVPVTRRHAHAIWSRRRTEEGIEAGYLAAVETAEHPHQRSGSTSLAHNDIGVL